MNANRKRAAALDAIDVLKSTWGYLPPRNSAGECTMLTAIRYYNRANCKSPDRLMLTDDLIARHIPLAIDLTSIDTDGRRELLQSAREAIETAMKEDES